MRKPVIVANWKMHMTNSEAKTYCDSFLRVMKESNVEIVLCPPFTALSAVYDKIKNTNVQLGAQDMFWEESGAFTSQISPLMLISVGCEYVIVGHSERRQQFGETDDTVNKKAREALQHNLIPIICVGETLEQREKGETHKVIESQVKNALKGVKGEFIIAYEPVWAIGTGKTATPEQAAEVHSQIRKLTDDKTRIIYGGSVTPENIKSLMAKEDIDGALVGTASLKPDSFAQIVYY